MNFAKRCSVLLVVVIALVLGVTRPARALSLTSKYPDIITTGVDASYNFASKTLTVSGSQLAMGLDYDGAPGGDDEYYITNADYLLTAQIDHDGTFLGGSFQIDGDLRDATNPATVLTSGTALKGTMVDFDKVANGAGGGVFEWIFNVTPGGYLPTRSLFSSNMGGIIMSATTGTFDANEFHQSFDLYDTTINTFVPAPMAFPAGIALLVASALFIAWRRLGAASIS
jgi:hypothetical protein